MSMVFAIGKMLTSNGRNTISAANADRCIDSQEIQADIQEARAPKQYTSLMTAASSHELV